MTDISVQGLEGEGERALAERAKAGDREAFGLIYRMYREPVYRLALARLSNAALADEIVQETFLRAFTALKRFDTNRDLGPWLATIAANLVVDVRRAQHRFVALEPEASEHRGDSDPTANAVLSLEGVRSLKRAIQALPARHRRILIASAIEGLAPRDVALLEDVSPSSVISVVYRARIAVRRSLRRLVAVALVMKASTCRTRRRLQRVGTWSTSMPSGLDAIASVGCWSAAAAVALVLTVGEPLSAPADTPSVRTTITDRLPRPAGRDVKLPDRVSGKGPPSSAPPLAIDAATGPTRTGSAAPSSGDLRIRVQGPDGAVLAYHDAHYDCRGTGTDLLPRSGPVQAGC